MLERFLLTDQVVVITGGGKGIGAATAEAAAEAGADVVVTARARTLAQGLAVRRTLAHSDLHAMGVRWTAAAENVGRGSSIEQVYASLQASPAHRANMVDPTYTNTGIGTARGRDGSVYVVQLFLRR